MSIVYWDESLIIESIKAKYTTATAAFLLEIVEDYFDDNINWLLDSLDESNQGEPIK